MDVLPPIRAVSFDVGGTLLEPWPSVGCIYAEVAAQGGVNNANAETLDRQFKTAWTALRDFDYSRDAWLEVVVRSFEGLCDRRTCEGFFPDLYERFAQRDAWRLFPDVLPALEELRSRGLRLAVISNWDERLHGLLRQFDLTPCLDVVVVSAEVGCRKPAAEIFQTAARCLNLPAGAILHVGNSESEDVEGARAAGFRALHLCRAPRSRPKLAVGSLREVGDRIVKLSRKFFR